MVAPAATCRLILLIRRMAPVTKLPLGTTTRPPPAREAAAIALRNASVLSVWLSPIAPKRVISKSRAGNDGGRMRARMRGTSSHGEGEDGPAKNVPGGDKLWPKPLPAESAAAPAPMPTLFRNSRRCCFTAHPVNQSCPDQNEYFMASWKTRGSPAMDRTWPNCPLLSVSTGFPKLGWFSTLNTSNLTCRFCDSRMRKLRAILGSKVRNPGPTMLLRGAFPKLPVAFCAKAAVLNQQLSEPTGEPFGQVPVNGSPT